MGDPAAYLIRLRDGGFRPRLGTCSSQHLVFATQFYDLNDRSARHFYHYCPVDTWRPQIFKEPKNRKSREVLPSMVNIG